MQTKAHVKASSKYNAKTYTRITINIKNTDEDVIKKLKSVESKSDYIVELIKKDINK